MEPATPSPRRAPTLLQACVPVVVLIGLLSSSVYLFGDATSSGPSWKELEAELFSHVRHMAWITGPSLVIALVLYVLAGFLGTGRAQEAEPLTSPLVPWNTCGAFMAQSLGVATIAYLRFCFLNLINPIVSAIYGFTGFTIERLELAVEETAA